MKVYAVGDDDGDDNNVNGVDAGSFFSDGGGGQRTEKDGDSTCESSELCTLNCNSSANPSGCNQSCTDSADCLGNCAAGQCNQTCSDSSTCNLNCSGGACIQTCQRERGLHVCVLRRALHPDVRRVGDLQHHVYRTRLSVAVSPAHR